MEDRKSVEQRIRKAGTNKIDGVLHREVTIALDTYAENFNDANPELDDISFRISVHKLNMSGIAEYKDKGDTILAEAELAVDMTEGETEFRIISSKVGFANVKAMKDEDQWRAALYRSLMVQLAGGFLTLIDLKRQAKSA